MNPPKQPPQNPAGAFVPPGDYSNTTRQTYIEQLERFPQELATVVRALDTGLLDTRYRNWTIRQIVHHLADSHLNSYVRFKWALTEPTPTIKSYDESLWSDVVDAREAPVECSLSLIDALHARWCQLLSRMTDEQWGRGFFHPEMDRVITLQEALPLYVWHGDHHLAQIQWICDQNG